MRLHFALAVLLSGLVFFSGSFIARAASWGANYFPNVTLQTQDGESVRFFDDLIEGKTVALNFIFTSCVDSCPLETAQLVQVQNILGSRLGRDIHFYSISIDPVHDTPDVLKAYRERFGASWTFLTGEEADIILLRRKLGLYIEEIQDGSNNHNVSMIIGNQASGRWMKRSPFENPHVLADQLANWLSDWKSPQTVRRYAEAPELRSIPRGEQIFRTRCAACHSLTGREAERALGPDLLGVTQRREAAWLLEWLRDPAIMIERQDPIALALYEEYDRLLMPNSRLNRMEAIEILDYIDAETLRLTGFDRNGPKVIPAAMSHGQNEAAADVVAVMNAWLREADLGAAGNAGYMTLVNVGSEPVTVIAVESDGFKQIEMHEMAMVDGLMTMRKLEQLVVSAGGTVRFEPGGKHLMMMGPRRKFQAGDALELTLRFKSGRQQTLPVKVAKM